MLWSKWTQVEVDTAGAFLRVAHANVTDMFVIDVIVLCDCVEEVHITTVQLLHLLYTNVNLTGVIWDGGVKERFDSFYLVSSWGGLEETEGSQPA